MADVWYEISASKLAPKMPGSDDNARLQAARGVKYGHPTYSEMYMRERAAVLGPWEVFFPRLCAKLGLKVTGEVTVIGVNDGQEVAILPAKSIAGYDIAEAALERGQVWYPHINFQRMDITTEVLPAKAADVYLCLRTGHIFYEKQLGHIMSQAYANLKSGGQVVFSVPGGYMESDGQITFGQKVAGGIDTDKPMIDVKRIADVMEKSGFRDVQIIDHRIEIFVVGFKPWTVLFVNGSPRKGGNSDQLIEQLMSKASGLGFRAKTVRLRQHPGLKFCTGCDHCHHEDNPNICVFKNDLFTLVVEPAMLEADAVYLVSPSYQGGVTGYMKVFMDRCEVFRKGRKLKGKLCGGAVIGGYAGGGQETVLAQMQAFTQIMAMRWIGAHGKRRSHLGGHLIAFEKGEVMDDAEGLVSAENVLIEMSSALKALA
ncbi:MAG: NAD(P)H-dependent oxidoreductase [Patescibacteria group bacterium]